MLPSDTAHRSLNTLAIELFAVTCGQKSECMRWPIDPRTPPMDELCLKTLDDFYVCSSGLTKACTDLDVYQDVSGSVASHFSSTNQKEKLKKQASPIGKYRLPKPGMLTTYEAFIPRKTRAGPNPRKSLRTALYRDCYRLRDQTQLLASKLLYLGKNVPSLVKYLFTTKGSSGDS